MADLSRRNFLKTMLATTALAPVAPAVVEALGQPPMLGVDLARTADSFYAVIHPGWEATIAEWKRETRLFGQAFLKFSADGPKNIGPFDVYLDPPLFKGELAQIDGIRLLVDEDEPLEIKYLDPMLEFPDDLIAALERREAMGRDWVPEPTRRVTRQQLLAEGFTRV